MHVEGKSNFETAAVVIYQKRFFRLSVEDPLWFFFLFLAKMMECKSGEWNGLFWLDKSYDKAEFFCQNFPFSKFIFNLKWSLWEFRLQTSIFESKKWKWIFSVDMWVGVSLQKSHFKSNEYFDLGIISMHLLHVFFFTKRHRSRKGTRDRAAGRKPVKPIQWKTKKV